LTGLIKLNLNHNQIDSLAGLKALTNLMTLDLSYNKVSDISDLSSLTKLVTLDISNNQISTPNGQTISAIQGMVDLEELNISYNAIFDISYLKTCTKIKTLNIGGNKDKSGNSISEISILEFLTSLESLNLEELPQLDISNMTILDEGAPAGTKFPKTLKVFSCQGCPMITNIDSLKFLPKLVMVSIMSCNVRSLAPLVDNSYFGSNCLFFQGGNPKNGFDPLTTQQADYIKDITTLKNNGVNTDYIF
jgi:Leucine-rich repeat (LRR) protein